MIHNKLHTESIIVNLFQKLDRETQRLITWSGVEYIHKDHGQQLSYSTTTFCSCSVTKDIMAHKDMFIYRMSKKRSINTVCLYH